ncbi:helix-turn-helix domain-containing protein [Paenibacillus sp. sgz500958]|uniref:helix-turn-helix domain-containing protein n=1 Tax=Paenibacillus sp. sgz500958 TaxID=3242475 RepID=UPI0036D2B96C
MSDDKASLILHPIRMRIIQTLAAGGKQTTSQLLKELEDIPQATMYRHLNKLLQAGLLQVAEENRVRGTLEKVYYLVPGSGDLTPPDVTEQSSGEHMTIFLKFITSLIGDYSRYTSQEHYNMIQDGISFRQVHLHLNDAEYAGMLGEMRAVMGRYAANEARGDRRRRMISTIVIPEVHTSSDSLKEVKGEPNNDSRSGK